MTGNNHSIADTSPVIPAITAPRPQPIPYKFIVHGFDKFVLIIFIIWYNILALTQKLSSIIDSLAPNSSSFLLHTSLGDLYVHANRMSGYRYHLKIWFADIYINLNNYTGNVPNAFVSFSAFSLWQYGLNGCLGKLCQLIEELGGRVNRHIVNRIDMCVDYHIHGGLSLDLLRLCRVSVARLSSHIMNGDRLGTFYSGSRNSGIYLRIYDKSAHLRSKHQLYYCAPISEKQADSIWRIEFEIRSKILKQFGIHTLDELNGNAGGLWHYLTNRRFSLRIPGYVHTEDRPVLPMWQDIQSRASEFGEPHNLSRVHRTTASGCNPDWYISHIAGCLPAFAVLSGCNGLPLTLEQLSAMLAHWWESRDFNDACRAKAVQLGIPETISQANEIVKGGSL